MLENTVMFQSDNVPCISKRSGDLGSIVKGCGTIGCAPHEGGVNRKRKLLKKRGYIRYIRYFTLITIGYEDTVGKTKDTLDTLLHYQ